MHATPEVLRLADALIDQGIIRRIWQRDVTLWASPPGAVANRLAWLDAARATAVDLPRVAELGAWVQAQGIRTICLMGTESAALSARAAQGLRAPQDSPTLVVLPATGEDQLLNGATSLDPLVTLFVVTATNRRAPVVASLEPLVWTRAERAIAGDTRRHFVAVTSPGSELEALARAREYHEVFLDPPDVAVRFSALSLMGLVPAAAVGASPKALHDAGAVMAEGCRQEHRENAGLMLGAFIAYAVNGGRTRLTLAFSPRLAAFGAWACEMVAASTGGVARPEVEASLRTVDAYGQDRAFVSLNTEEDAPDTARLDDLEHAGHPVLRLSMRTDGLGAEFFRWHFGAVVAAAALGSNPFEDTDV